MQQFQSNQNGHEGKSLSRFIEHIKHYLPSQTPIKDFIHHNTLHAYQDLKFYDAIFKAENAFGYQVSLKLEDFRKLYKSGRIKEGTIDKVIKDRYGINDVEYWKSKMIKENFPIHEKSRLGRLRKLWNKQYEFDLDNQVHPLLFRIFSSYLDQGIAIEKFPLHPDGFLASLRSLEKNSYFSIFKTKAARQILLDENTTLEKVLKILVGDPSLYEHYLFDQAFSHQGWSGLIAAVEASPHTLLDRRKISLEEAIIFECILEIDVLTYKKPKWKSINLLFNDKLQAIFEDKPTNEFQKIIMLWQDAFEWSYYDDVLMAFIKATKGENTIQEKSFQAIFCIDERECSLRRHIENVDIKCETFGCPGFFGVEFYFQPEHGQFYEKLCPAPVTPKYLIKEIQNSELRPKDSLYTNEYATFLGGTWRVFFHGLWSLMRMIKMMFQPKMSAAISNAFVHMLKENKLTIENEDLSNIENGLQVGFTIQEMANRVENLLKSIGLVNDFATVIYVVAHGSSSANNPHHSAHDCGACSGRPGSANARVFAFMANHPVVRTILKSRGIDIPITTQFLGGMHDTSADTVDFYDEHFLSEENKIKNRVHMKSIDKALDLNAKERSRRFASIDTKQDLIKIRKAILERSVSMFEPRPELGHGTNSLCIIGRRSLTKGVFLDRRAFLNSYDPTIDPDGRILENVMKPIGLVCGGINLEYYFSRVDNYKLGAGTKLPHNVVGLVGVANSSDGDLRPGLPLQMIEVHDPIRLLVIVEHKPDIVHRAIQSSPEVYEWYINEWVHIAAMDPETQKIHYFKNGKFEEYHPEHGKAELIDNILSVIHHAKEMETSYIVDATKENLPPAVII